MSILDDEDILMDGVKENMNNPFYTIREIFLQAEKENNCLLYPYKNDILKLLSTIEIPQHTKWFIDFNVIELVDSSIMENLRNFIRCWVELILGIQKLLHLIFYPKVLIRELLSILKRCSMIIIGKNYLI